MSVLLNECWMGLDFDEDIRMQGYDFAEVVDIDYLRIERHNDRSKVVLVPIVRDWIEAECAGEALLVAERDDFLIAFNDPTDAMLYRTRFSK